MLGKKRRKYGDAVNLPLNGRTDRIPLSDISNADATRLQNEHRYAKSTTSVSNSINIADNSTSNNTGQLSQAQLTDNAISGTSYVIHTPLDSAQDNILPNEPLITCKHTQSTQCRLDESII